MSDAFFQKPIINGPYGYPSKHWELDEDGQPTQKIIERRRLAKFVTPVPKPRKRSGGGDQQNLPLGGGPSSQEQTYNPTPVINELRRCVDQWRAIKDERAWRVTGTTARLLKHWRSHSFAGVRPFFCQIEAVETAIWLSEVAPSLGKEGSYFLEHVANANNDANPGLNRLALKLATGAGKTTVMAMLIAWQVLNAVRSPASKKFSRGFLIIAPGLTIRDRLQVLQPHDPNSYYRSREIIPVDLLQDLGKAKIVIANYHAFKHRECLDISKVGRQLLQGRHAPEIATTETDGQMLQRVLPELMGLKQLVVINDEAHHCYREKPSTDGETKLDAEERQEAERNNAAARLWISGAVDLRHRSGPAQNRSKSRI